MASYGTPSPWLAAGLEDLVFTSALAGACIWLTSVSKPKLSQKQQRAVLEELAHIPQAKLVAARGHENTKSQSRNICDYLKPDEPTAVIIWGSQGGTAESLARRYASDLSRRYVLRTLAFDLDDLDHGHLPNLASSTLVVFVLSTYGEGEPPDNALSFFEDLQKMSGSGCRLDRLRYCIFGLGSSNYRLYNKAALEANALLLQMGAQRVGPVGLGDDSKGTTEEDFSAWKEGLEQQIGDHFKLETKESPYEPHFEVRALDKKRQDLFEGRKKQAQVIPHSQPHGGRLKLPVSSARDLLGGGKAETSRHYLHLEFDLPSSAVSYETGDYLQVWPINPDSEVESLLNILGLSRMGNTTIEIKATENTTMTKSQLPSPTSLMSLFRHHLDICGLVSREMARGLAEFVPDIESRRRLLGLVNDREIFRAQVTSKRMTLAGFLHYISAGNKDHLHIPVSYILENLKRLQARSYSISSSAIVSPGQISLLLLATGESVEREGNVQFRGLCSHYLLDVQRNWNARGQSQQQAVPQPLSLNSDFCSIIAKIRRSDFKLPSEPSAPIIMVGAGTGVAPFRGFVKERIELKRRGQAVGKTLLFVGHRASDSDFYYQEVWQEAQDVLGEAFDLNCAFSRQGRRTYVQDLLATQGSKFFDLLDAHNSATLYLCGSSSMAGAVKEALMSAWTTSCGQTSGADDGAAAKRWLSELQRTRRLQEDSWG